jgi:hypothetical protein
VWREFWFVFTAQTACDFAGHTTEDFALRVNHEPVTLDFMRLSHKCLHDWILKNSRRDHPGKTLGQMIFAKALCAARAKNTTDRGKPLILQ